MIKKSLFLINLFFIKLSLFSQNNIPFHKDSVKSFFSISITQNWKRTNISNVAGEIDYVKGSINSGYIVDFSFMKISKKVVYNFSLGHGNYKEGFYFRYNNVSNQAFPLTNIEGFEKNRRPIQYSSFKFFIANNFGNRLRNIMYYGGFDFRFNWGHSIFTNADRLDVSYGSTQQTYVGMENESTTIMFNANSRLQRSISINPIIGLDYFINLKNKSFLSLGLFISVPFMPIIKSKVVFYPEFDDLKSHFNTSFNGGMLGLKMAYLIPN